MTPRVGIVMANYNYARYLAMAIESVLAQTFADFELVVVDDGSTDHSLTIIEKYLHDPRVRCVRANHLGQPRAKNLGIAETRSPFVAFLDADDAWLPTKLEKQLALFDADPKVGVVHCRRNLIDEAGQPLPYAQPAMPRGDVMASIFRNNFVCFSAAMVRRGVFEHLGQFDPTVDLAIDYDMWLRVAGHYHFDFVDEVLVHYRVGHGNLSKRVGERLKTAMLMMDRFLDTRDGANRIDRQATNRSRAETYCNMAWALRPYAPLQSGRWFAKAIAAMPGYRPAWKGLAGVCLPTGLRRLARAAMGGTEWDRVYRTPENDPRNA